MGIANQIYHEMEIKADLIAEGVNIDGAALDGVGTKYIENINYVFDYMRHGLKSGTLWPSEFFFPNRTVYEVAISHQERRWYFNPREKWEIHFHDRVC